MASPKSPLSPKSPPKSKSTSPEPQNNDENASTVPEHTPLEADDAEDEGLGDDGDSTYGSLHSSTTSLRDEMIEQLKEHGRSYQGYMGAKYFLPMDEQELERLDLQCHLVWLSLDKQYSHAPTKNLQRVLDVGCGTGFWAIQFADEHPETEVLGVDLAPVQPDCVPPNLTFEVDDLEQPWTFTRKFDLIHCQMMLGAFQDWPRFLRQCFEFNKPDGYVELHEFDFTVHCDDGSLPADSTLAQWVDLIGGAAAKAGFPPDVTPKLPGMLRDAGYVDVVARGVKWPINPWPRDPKHKELGRWAHENFRLACEGMSLALLTRVEGWSVEEVQVFLAKLRGDLQNRKYHAYWNFWVTYGRKPMEATAGSS